MSDQAPPIPPAVEDPRAPHLVLPLPAPNANPMRTDAERIAQALIKIDAEIGRHRLHQLLDL